MSKEGWGPERKVRIGLGLSLFVLLLLVLLTAGDYGYSVDENPSQRYGQALLEGYEQAFRTGDVRESLAHALAVGRERTFDTIQFRGATFHMFAEAFGELSGFGEFFGRRLFTPLVACLGVVGTFALGRLLAGTLVGFLSALLLLLMPSWYGHGFINPADMPFAVGYIWSLFFSVRIARAPSSGPLSDWGLWGLAVGLTITTRFGGVLLIAYLGLACSIFLARAAQSSWSSARAELGRLALRGALAGAIAYAVILILWPFALLHPFDFAWASLSDTQSHATKRMVLLGGKLFWSADLPRSFLLRYMLVKLPLLHLGLFAVACALGLSRLSPKTARHVPAQPEAVWLVWLAVLFPMSFAVFTRPNDYDAIRHFLFLLPPVACLCALALVGLRNLLARRFGRANLVVFGTGAALAALPLVAMVRLHPYEYTYYNELVGGVRGAQGRYLDDYWGTAFREAMHRLGDALDAEGLPPGERHLEIAGCGPSLKWPIWPAEPFLPVGVEATRDVRRADFFITISKWPCSWRTPKGARHYLDIGRDGATFVRVYDVRAARSVVGR